MNKDKNIVIYKDKDNECNYFLCLCCRHTTPSLRSIKLHLATKKHKLNNDLFTREIEKINDIDKDNIFNENIDRYNKYLEIRNENENKKKDNGIELDINYDFNLSDLIN